MLNIIFYLFILVIAVQFFYYIVIFGKFSFYKSSKQTSQNFPISVIVCAKNEEENVKKLLPLLLNQDYFNYEIVLIDDASRDETLEVFEEFEKLHKNIKIVKVENNEAFWGNKKFALTMGIKAAKNEHLLFTDADCYPTSDQWISEMSSHFNEEKSLILGFGSYEKIAGSFLNKIIRFETLITATQYFSWAKFGKPYMGVGRNLAYKKSEFFEVNGFVDHMKIRSGDDDLFVNQVANSSNTAICYSTESFTKSKPKTTFSDWINQKRRHIATASYYKFFDKMQLFVFYISQITFLFLAIFLLITQFQSILVLSLIGFRYMFSWISLGFASGKLKENDVVYFFPIMELVLLFFQFYLFVINIFSKPVHWK